MNENTAIVCCFVALMTMPVVISVTQPGCRAPASAPAPHIAQAEADLCAARAVWKVFAAENHIAPAEGSARAKLEAAEDAVCAVRAESNP